MTDMRELIEGDDRSARLLKWLDQINKMMKDSVELDSNLMRFSKSIDGKNGKAIVAAHSKLRDAFDGVTDALYDIRQELMGK